MFPIFLSLAKEFVWFFEGLEEILKLIGQSDRMPNEHVIWINRKFTGCDKDPGVDKIKQHFDFMNNNVDERAGDLLLNLNNQLHDTVETANKIGLEVAWQPGGISSESKEHAQYLDNLCETYRTVLKETVGKLMNKKIKEHESELIEAQMNGTRTELWFAASSTHALQCIFFLRNIVSFFQVCQCPSTRT